MSANTTARRSLPVGSRLMAVAVEHTQEQSVRYRVALACLAFLGPLAIAVGQRGFVYDDPYILLRYAQHLADGIGWQFNPAMPTENAVTSPIYVLLVAAGSFLGGSAALWSTILYTIAWGLGGIVLARILDADGRPMAAWLACALYSMSPLLANVRGMETTLYLLLALGALRAIQQQRWALLGCLLGLLTVTRSDGILPTMVLIGWLAIYRRPHLPAVLAPAVAISGVGMAAMWAITGAPFPSTLSAKLAQRDGKLLGGHWDFLAMLNINGISGIGAWSPMVPVLSVAGLVMVGLAVFGTVKSVRRREFAVPALAVFAALVVIEYGLVLRMPIYIWHYAPWTLWVIAGTAAGIEDLFRGRRAVGAAAAATLALLMAVLAIHLGPDDKRSQYPAVAEWIDHDSHGAHPTVAVSEIGEIGYYSRANIIDYVGLLDHRALNSLRRGDFTWWLTQHPDYWVTAADFSVFDGQSLATAQFRNEYSEAARFGSVVVYRRN